MRNTIARQINCFYPLKERIIEMHYCYMADLISVCLGNHNIIHSKQMIREQINAVKTASSLLTINNVLNAYNIKSETCYSDVESLLKDKRQAIASLKIGGGRFVVLKNIDSEKNVKFYDPIINKDIQISLDAFLKLWNNILIYTMSGFSENYQQGIITNNDLETRHSFKS